MKIIRTALAALLLLASSATPAADRSGPAADVARSLAGLPAAEKVDVDADGVPRFVRGDLGRVGAVPAGKDAAAWQRALARPLGAAIAPFRLAVTDLAWQRLRVDEQGNAHIRYQQTFRGLPVVGGDLVVHVDRKGTIFAVNGTARGRLPAGLGSRDIGAVAAREAVRMDTRWNALRIGSGREVYVLTERGRAFKAHAFQATGERGRDPVRDEVFVDADSGAIVAVHPHVYFAENRNVYSANNASSLPGTLKRSEGQPVTGDLDVDAAYDALGDFYEGLHTFFGRDSYDNAGAVVIGTVHYSVNYCNAFWNGVQLVYGDGNAAQNCLPLTRGVDVTGHEMYHAVTEHESGLVYAGETGGLNEALSDIFGAFTEAFADGGKTGTLAISDPTWLVGEDVLPPWLRKMSDPFADGQSLDFWTSSAGNNDSHYSSGIGNLAFYLLAQGGMHPRGKSAVVVPALGMEKAIRIFHKANVDILTSGAKYLDAGNATVMAAQLLGYSLDDQSAVALAWQAVGVPVTAPGDDTIPLSNNNPVPGISGATGSQKFFKLVVPAGQAALKFKLSGGTGNADLYVRRGVRPTATTFNCRSHAASNQESCGFTNPAAGTWYVMVAGTADYAGATLVGSYKVQDLAGEVLLTNGQAVGPIGDAKNGQRFFRLEVPAGQGSLQFALSGGTGDADLYVGSAARPTTSAYYCRSINAGNTETCTIPSPAAGTWYVMVFGRTGYAKVSLQGTYAPPSVATSC